MAPRPCTCCHCTGRAVGKVTHMDPNTALREHRQRFSWQKFGKAQAFWQEVWELSPSPTSAPTSGRGAKRGGLKHCFDSELAHKRHYSLCRLRFYPAQQHISLSSGTARSWTLPPFVIVCNTMPTQKNTSIKHTSIRKENVITWNSPL